MVVELVGLSTPCLGHECLWPYLCYPATGGLSLVQQWDPMNNLKQSSNVTLTKNLTQQWGIGSLFQPRGSENGKRGKKTTGIALRSCINNVKKNHFFIQWKPFIHPQSWPPPKFMVSETTSWAWLKNKIEKELGVVVQIHLLLSEMLCDCPSDTICEANDGL